MSKHLTPPKPDSTFLILSSQWETINLQEGNEFSYLRTREARGFAAAYLSRRTAKSSRIRSLLLNDDAIRIRAKISSKLEVGPAWAKI
jgi:hypothetical protein